MEAGQRGERRGEDIADASSMVYSTSRLGAIVTQAEPVSSSSNSDHADHIGQNSSQNRQEVVKICRLREVYSTGERAAACYCLYPNPPGKRLGNTASNQLVRKGRS